MSTFTGDHHGGQNLVTALMPKRGARASLDKAPAPTPAKKACVAALSTDELIRRAAREPTRATFDYRCVPACAARRDTAGARARRARRGAHWDRQLRTRAGVPPPVLEGAAGVRRVTRAHPAQPPVVLARSAGPAGGQGCGIGAAEMPAGGKGTHQEKGRRVLLRSCELCVLPSALRIPTARRHAAATRVSRAC